jgi:hypothetical protein
MPFLTGPIGGNQSINQSSYLYSATNKNLYSRALYISNIAIAFKKYMCFKEAFE